MGKNDEYISISLSEDVLKIIQLKGIGLSAKVSHIFAQDVKGISDLDMPKTIQAALKGLNIQSAQVLCVVSPGMITTKNIEIPSVSPNEIKSIVNLQAGRHTPFSREEIQIGYVTLGVYKNDYTKVLLIIANRNILKNQISIFEKAGLKVRKILFAPEGEARFYSEALGLNKESAPIGIIDISKQSTDFVVTLRGLPITSRNIPIGFTQLEAEGKAGQDKLVDELSKTIEAYKTDDIDQLPTKYILSTDDQRTKELQQLLQAKLKWDVEISPYVNFIKPSAGVLEKLGQSYSDTSFLDIIAATAISDEAQVNLIPEEIQFQKSVEDQGKEVLKAATLAFFILIIVAISLGLRIYFENSYLKKLETNYQENKKEVEMLKSRSLKTNIIQDYLNSRMVSLDVMNELYRNIPNEIYLTSIAMDENSNISIQGVSDIASLVFNLGSSLKESKLFKSVEIKSTTAKKDRGKDVSAFEIIVKLVNAPDDDTKAKKEKAEE